MPTGVNFERLKKLSQTRIGLVGDISSHFGHFDISNFCPQLVRFDKSLYLYYSFILLVEKNSIISESPPGLNAAVWGVHLIWQRKIRISEAFILFFLFKPQFMNFHECARFPVRKHLIKAILNFFILTIYGPLVGETGNFRSSREWICFAAVKTWQGLGITASTNKGLLSLAKKKTVYMACLQL